MDSKSQEYVELMFENGDIYKGQVQDDKFNGYGLYSKKDKFIYVGQFQNSQFHGYGKYWDPAQLMLFQGEFQNGQKSGRGRLESYRNNISYSSLVPQQADVDSKNYLQYIRDQVIVEIRKDLENEVSAQIKYANDDMNSHNKQDSFDNDTIEENRKERTRCTFEKRYLGEFRSDFKNGSGVMKYSNSDVFIGQFKNDKRHGCGRYIYLSAGAQWLMYLGEFNEDVMSGFGKMRFVNGDLYTGEFKNNKMHDENANIEYSNLDIYKGGVAQNMKHSKNGEYLYSNGDRYLGDFRNDQKHGDGVITLLRADRVINNCFKDDITYSGQFEKDRKTGKGQVDIRAENLRITALFDQNELINDKKAIIEYMNEQNE